MCANLGALAGGIVIAHLSTFIGRRTAILIGNVIAGIMIYFWAFHPMWITAFHAIWYSGSWSVVPIHLSELSPPHFRSFVSGVLYQLGNLVSSASSTIEATIEEQIHDYGKTMAILLVPFGLLDVCCFIGPENRGAGWVLKEMTI